MNEGQFLLSIGWIPGEGFQTGLAAPAIVPDRSRPRPSSMTTETSGDVERYVFGTRKVAERAFPKRATVPLSSRGEIVL